MSQTREQDSSLRWSRSLRASQARRAAAARMRRWSRRRRITATTMAVAVLGFGGVAAAQQTTGSGSSSSATAGRTAATSVSAVQQQLGVTADGVAGPQTRRALKTWQRKNGLQADGVIGPATLKAMGISAAKASPRSATTKDAAAIPTGTASTTLEKIAQCESGGDPTAVSSSGQYRGKYQFDRQTWRANGGSGDPAAASEATQDRIAAKLLAARGTAPWPVCGK
ncbi:transglycosylase family protein [Patulibacter sp.]|uniref:transglycosylase family protein n=1 Tax=Patulibacter sp. TaxID=1912859 RepID=UPI00271B2DEE|nr:transglycosylase family protein [Patulibacter sp.]MDO9408525.1 transglycosylase family protein [Patulibacter sp.]